MIPVFAIVVVIFIWSLIDLRQSSSLTKQADGMIAHVWLNGTEEIWGLNDDRPLVGKTLRFAEIPPENFRTMGQRVRITYQVADVICSDPWCTIVRILEITPQ